MNNVRINKRILIIAYSFILTLLIIVMPINEMYNKTLFIFLMPLAIYSLILNLKNKVVFFGLINLINVEMGLTMFLYLYVVKVKIVGWRLKLYTAKYANISFRYFLMSECIFLIVFFLFNISQGFNVEKDEKTPIFSNILIRFFTYIVPIVFLLRVNIFVIRDYAVNFDSYAGIFFSFGSILSCIFAKEKSINRYINLLDWIIMCIYITISFILALNGYRTYLVAIFFSLIAMSVLEKRSINMKTVISMAIIGIMMYGLMIIAKGVFRGLPPETYIASHESSIFFSLIAMVRNVSESGTANAYLNILQSIVPSAISHKANMNSGAFMMQYIDPANYNSTKISIGTYFLAEGYLSYGKIGIPIISIIYAIFSLTMDKLRSITNKKSIWYMAYMYMISQLYAAMWYGAYAFVKYTVYFVLLLFFANLRYMITGKKIRYWICGKYIE